MINDKIVRKAELCLFGDIELPVNFHEKLFKFMKCEFKRIHTVVLYKLNERFCSFLEDFSGLPDIGRKEIVILTNGTLKYTPDYCYSPLRPVLIDEYISDEVLHKVMVRLFDIAYFPSNFTQLFRDFINNQISLSDSYKVSLCKSNQAFAEFIKPFYNPSHIRNKKLVIHANGAITYTPDSHRCALKEVHFKEEKL